MARLAGIIYKKSDFNNNSVFYRARVLEMLEIFKQTGNSYKLINEIKNKKFNITIGFQSKYNIFKYVKNIQNEIPAGISHPYIDGKIYNLRDLYNKYSSKFTGKATNDLEKLQRLLDFFGIEIVKEFKGPFSILFTDRHGDIFLARDFLGRKPLYYSLEQKSENLHFASEVKPLARFCSEINEFPPGSFIKNLSKPIIIKDIKSNVFSPIDEAHLKEQKVFHNQDSIVKELEVLFFKSIEKRLFKKKSNQEIGIWLSGGMDSSIIASVVREFTDNIFTFSVGFDKSKDIGAARIVSKYLGTKHTEFILKIEDLFNLIPKAIYTLESFDAPLVRSTLGNIIASELSSKSDIVFSGEGGDEIFAGYNHFLNLDSQYAIQNALIKSLKSLHNTALQRVDRSSNLFGINIRLPMLDEDLLEFALQIPTEYKVNYDKKITKYILRIMASKYLPDFIVWRPKDKFWEGSGIYDRLQKRIVQLISDKEYENNKTLIDGFVLRNKEELYYYKIFREYFPHINYNNFLSFTENFS